MSAITRALVTNSSVTVGTTAAVALKENNQRQFLYVENPLTTGNNLGVTIDGTTPVIGAAGTILLTPGNGIMFDIFVPMGPVTVIGSGTGTPATVYSYE